MLLRGLRDELGNSGSTILHAINDLESYGLIIKYGKVYQLTPIGKLYAIILEDVSSSVHTLEKFHDFWNKHDISFIPNHLLRRIGVLKDATIIENDSIELNRVHSSFQDILLSSKHVYGVSPIFHPDYVLTFHQMLRNGASVELIVTPEVMNKTLEFAEFEEISEYMFKGNLKLFLVDSLRVALTVTENSFSLGLFDNEGNYDYSKDIVSNHMEVIDWGMLLFNEFRRKGKQIDVKELR